MGAGDRGASGLFPGRHSGRTFDTDYLLVREAQIDEAIGALEQGGHTIEY